MKAKVLRPAIRVGEAVVDAFGLHAFCWELVFKQGLMPKRCEEDMTADDWKVMHFEVGIEEGFLLDTGEFVDRMKALEIAEQAGQLLDETTYKPGELHVPDIELTY